MIGTRIALVFFYFIVTMLAILAAPTAVVTSSEELKLERCVDHLGKVQLAVIEVYRHLSYMHSRC